MSKRKIKIILITILAMAIIGTILGVVGYFSDGFKNWDKFIPKTGQTETVVVEKQLVSTTIVSEKYGTFELPVNNFITTNGINKQFFPIGTNFNYIIEKEFEKVEKLGGVISEDSKLVIDYTATNGGPLVSMFDGHNVYGTGINAYEFENNIITFKSDISDDMRQYYELTVFDFSTLSVTTPTSTDEHSRMNSCYTNFYCSNLFLYIEDDEFSINVSFPSVIISDKGCPLADYIYDEIMADSMTKITYNYAKVC